jgi:hypothetical protein
VKQKVSYDAVGVGAAAAVVGGVSSMMALSSNHTWSHPSTTIPYRSVDGDGFVASNHTPDNNTNNIQRVPARPMQPRPQSADDNNDDSLDYLDSNNGGVFDSGVHSSHRGGRSRSDSNADLLSRIVVSDGSGVANDAAATHNSTSFDAHNYDPRQSSNEVSLSSTEDIDSNNDTPFSSTIVNTTNSTINNIANNTSKKKRSHDTCTLIQASFRDIIGHGQAKLRLDEALLPLALPFDLAESVLTGTSCPCCCLFAYKMC